MPEARDLESAVGTADSSRPGLNKPLVWSSAVLLALCFLLGAHSAFWMRGGPLDEGALLVSPELLLRGLVPHRDFYYAYGPGNLYTLAAAYAAFGTAFGVERWVGTAYRILVLAGVFSAAYLGLRDTTRDRRTVVALACTALALVDLLNLEFAAFAWFATAGFLLLALGLLSAEGASRGRAALGGLAFGIAVLFRPETLPVAAAMAITLLWTESKPERIAAWRGFAVPLAALALYIWQVSPALYWRDAIVQEIFVVSAIRRLPLPHEWPELAPVLLLLLATLLHVVTAMRAWRTRNDGWPSGMALAILSLGILPQALQRADMTHLVYVSCISVALTPLSISRLPGLWPKAPKKLRGDIVLAAAALCVFQPLVWPALKQVVDGLQLKPVALLHRNGRTYLPVMSDQMAMYQSILDNLPQIAPPGTPIFIGPLDLRRTNYNDAFLYYLLPDYPPATRYIVLDPGAANASDSTLAQELPKAGVLLLSDNDILWQEKNHSEDPGPDAPNQVVKRLFMPFAKIGFYWVFVRKTSK